MGGGGAVQGEPGCGVVQTALAAFGWVWSCLDRWPLPPDSGLCTQMLPKCMGRAGPCQQPRVAGGLVPRVCGHGRSRRDRRLQRSPEVPQSRTLIGFPLGVLWVPACTEARSAKGGRSGGQGPGVLGCRPGLSHLCRPGSSSRPFLSPWGGGVTTWQPCGLVTIPWWILPAPTSGKSESVTGPTLPLPAPAPDPAKLPSSWK